MLAPSLSNHSCSLIPLPLLLHYRLVCSTVVPLPPVTRLGPSLPKLRKSFSIHFLLSGFWPRLTMEIFTQSIADKPNPFLRSQRIQTQSPPFILGLLVADTRLYTLPCRSVRPSVPNIFELRAVFALPLLPNHPRLSCRVSGLVLKVPAHAT